MSVIDSFVKILAPLNIYDLSQGTNVYQELLTYANELDKLNQELDTLLREYFICTAESYGLSNIEKIYTAEDKLSTSEARREKILERLNINDSYFSVKDMKRALLSLGVKEFNLLELPARCMLVFEITGEYTESQKSFIKSEIKKFVPVAFEVQIYFGGLSWSEFESKNWSFSSMDSQNLSWEKIDELK